MVVARRYDKDAGIGTVISLMLSYVVVLAIAWTLFFVVWYLAGIPLGPGSPVRDELGKFGVSGAGWTSDR